MPATVVTTARGTGTLNTENRRVRDVTPGVIKLEPDAGPLTTILAKLRKRKTEDPQFEWIEDELLPRFDTLSVDLTAGASTMTVSNYQRFRKDDLVQINDKEIVRVTATPTSSEVSIKRGVGTTFTSGQAASATQRLRILGNSAMEGDTARSVLTTQKVRQLNYVQEMKMPFEVTEQNLRSKTYGGNDLLEEQANKLIEHKREMEQCYLFGERFEDTTGIHPQRNTRGIIPFITTNVKDAGGTLEEPEFEEFLRIGFRFGTKQKIFIGSSHVMTTINAWGRDKLRLVPKDQSYGITMTQYHNAGRDIRLVEHFLLENDDQGDLSGYAGYGILLDIGDLEARYMGNKMTELTENIQNNDSRTRKDEYYSIVGLEAHMEKKHALLKGVSE